MGFNIIFILIFAFFKSSKCQNTCYGLPHKCPTQLKTTPDTGIFANNSLKPIEIHQNVSETTQCRDLCMNSTLCFMSVQNTSHNICSLYDHGTFFQKSGTGLYFYVFECCDTNQCSVRVNNRCPGNWVKYSGFIIRNVSDHSNIDTISTSTEEWCRSQCINNSTFNRICTSFVIYEGDNHRHCSINFPWAAKKLDYVPFRDFVVNKNATTFTWQCCNNEADPENNEHCRRIESNGGWCRGQWHKQKQHDVVNLKSAPTFSPFKTLDINTCLSECEHQEYCTGRVWFNQTTANCLLERRNNSRIEEEEEEDENLSVSELIGTLWVWKCCQKSFVNETNGIEDESCLCVENKSLVYLVHDFCDNPNRSSKYGVIVNGLGFERLNGGDNVRVVNNSERWLRVDTGFEYLWLNEESTWNGGVVACDVKYCRICNANQISTEKIRLYGRETGWYSYLVQYPRSYISYYKKPSIVVINFSVMPYYPCYTIDCAMCFALRFQRYHWDQKYDFGSNFLINLNGLVLEDAGAKHAGKVRRCPNCPYEYQDIFSLQVIGNFLELWPRESVMETIKSFIQYSVKQGWLSENYELTTWNQTGQNLLSKLYVATGNWPNSNANTSSVNGRLIVVRDCPNPYLKYLSVLCFVPIIISCVYYVLYRHRVIGHSHLCQRMFKLSHCKSSAILQMKRTASSHVNREDIGVEYFECHAPSEMIVIVDKDVEMCVNKLEERLNHFAMYYLNRMSCVKRSEKWSVDCRLDLRKFSDELNECDYLKCCRSPTDVFVVFENKNKREEFTLIVSHLHCSNDEEDDGASSIVSMLKEGRCFCGLNCQSHSCYELGVEGLCRSVDVSDRIFGDWRSLDLMELKRSIMNKQDHCVMVENMEDDGGIVDELYDLVYCQDRERLL